jgi:hypothetical protein
MRSEHHEKKMIVRAVSIDMENCFCFGNRILCRNVAQTTLTRKYVSTMETEFCVNKTKVRHRNMFPHRKQKSVSISDHLDMENHSA